MQRSLALNTGFTLIQASYWRISRMVLTPSTPHSAIKEKEMSERKRYAVVGLGSRSRMFTTAVLKDYADQAELVAFCDVNQTRMDYYNQYYAKTLDAVPVPTYKPDRFDDMLREQRVDTVIVTS